MSRVIKRLLDLRLPRGQSAFLWGPRRVGKSYWIRQHHETAPIIDLLKSDVFAEYAARPALLRERFAGKKDPLIVIDEIQKVPALLDEVHWLIENASLSFLLTGSSARKLRRGHANLLAGRARRHELGPLSWREVEGFELKAALSSGMLRRRTTCLTSPSWSSGVM